MGAVIIHTLETLFRKHFWVVNLLIIFLIALFVALGLSHLLMARLAPFTVTQPGDASRQGADTAGTRAGQQSLAISELLAMPSSEENQETIPTCTRNEDCSSPMVCDNGICIEPVETIEETPVPAGGDCLSSDIAAALVGTMASANNEWSFGLVQDQTASRTVMVRAGDQLAGATVIRVGRNRVYLLNEGREECLKAGEQPATSRPLASRTTSRTTERAAEPQAGRIQPPATGNEEDGRVSQYRTLNLREGVRRVSPTNYEIERSAIDSALQDPSALQSQAPEFEQNYNDSRSPDGIRLTSIPAGSIFSTLGVRPNDVITGVNGRAITTPQRAMEVYEALQTESHIELTVLRRGRPRTLVYDIH